MSSYLSTNRPKRILTATGHRPAKLLGYSPEAATFLARIAEVFLRILDPDEVVSGFALGWDTAIVEAALMLQIPVIAGIPSRAQPNTWPEASRVVYYTLLEQATEIKYLSESETYQDGDNQVRNEWLYDRGTETGALWDGSKGGTYNYLKYAVAQASKPMYNIWPLFVAAAKGDTIVYEKRLSLERFIIGFPDGICGAFPRPGG